MMLAVSFMRQIVCIVVLYSKTLTMYIIDVAMFHRMHRCDLRIVEATWMTAVNPILRGIPLLKRRNSASEPSSQPFSLVCVH